MRGLTLWQPWASAIALGLKTVETRSWETDYQGPLAIHAAKRSMRVEELSQPGYEQLVAKQINFDALPYGEVVALVHLDRCVATPFTLAKVSEAYWGDFSEDRFGWLLSDIRPLAEPLPLNGARGLWHVPDAAAAEIAARARRMEPA